MLLDLEVRVMNCLNSEHWDRQSTSSVKKRLTSGIKQQHVLVLGATDPVMGGVGQWAPEQ